jgi:uncharacterized protein YutE (UPF0331/DUF86 family)
MPNLEEKVAAEAENISNTLASLPEPEELRQATPLELAGVAALLHNFYNGVENILKQVVRHQTGILPSGVSWHRELLEVAVQNHIISSSTEVALRQYLAFRHFFVHSYALQLVPEPLKPLVQEVKAVFRSFYAEVGECVGL